MVAGRLVAGVRGEMNVPKWKRVMLILSALTLLNGCDSNKVAPAKASAPTSAAAPASAPPVAVGQDFEASAPIIVENQVDVAAQREGVVVQIGADIGTNVRKGQFLARLDDRQLSAERDASKSKAAAIEAEMHNWAAQQKVDEVDLVRAEGMWKAGLITQQQLDHARYRVTQSQFEAERERHNLENARSSLKVLELELAKTVIVAPFDGVVARRYVRDGQRVAVGDRLFWVSAVAPLRVRFTLPERFLGRVKSGEEIEVSAVHGSEGQHRARVLKVSPVVDPSSGTIEVLAELVGPGGELRPGMTATVRIPERQ